MTTKEQERKALEQIRKIVAGLGENSYVGTAFEGCFEIAEDNIKNDFACSMKQRKDNAEFAEDQLRAKVADLKKKAQEDGAVIDRHAAYIDELERKNNDLRNRAELAEQHMHLEAERANKGWDKVKEQEQEIMKLKAKLYDLMVGTVA